MSTCNEGAKQGENLSQFLFSLNKDLEFFFLKMDNSARPGYLFKLRECRTLTGTQQDQFVHPMGQAGPHDQRPAVFQARTRSSPKGWIMASKTEWSPITLNEEKTKQYESVSDGLFEIAHLL